MSGKLMGQCFTLVLSRSARDVLMAFCNYAADNGDGAYPSLARVAWMCDLSKRQVRRIVSTLVDAGLLEPVAFAKGGRGHSACYRVNLSAGLQKPEYRRYEKADTQTSPFNRQKADMLIVERRTHRSQKADILDSKDDTQVSSDPSFDPSAMDPPFMDPHTHTNAERKGRARSGACVTAPELNPWRSKPWSRAKVKEYVTWRGSARDVDAVTKSILQKHDPQDWYAIDEAQREIDFQREQENKRRERFEAEKADQERLIAEIKARQKEKCA